MTAQAGIIVSAKDKASAVLTNVGKAGKQSMSALRTGADKAGAALKAIGVGAAIFNQTLELAKKGAELFRMAVLDTVSAAFEFRKKSDPAVKQLKEFANQFEILRARVGDVLIPILQGVADVMQPVIKSVIRWINANRVLIGTKLVEWLVMVSKTAVGVFGKAAIVVAKAFYGWRMAINLVKAAFAEQFGYMADGLAKFIELNAKVIGFFDKDYGESIKGAADSVQLLADTFHDSGTESLNSAMQANDEMIQLEGSINRVSAALDKGIGQIGVAAINRLNAGITGGLVKTEELGDTEEKAAVDIDKISEKRIAAINDKMESELKAAKKKDAQLSAELDAVLSGVATSVASVWGEAFAQIATGGEGASKAIAGAVVRSAQVAVQAAAASGAAQAAFSQAGIPIIGPALAVGASAMIFGIINALLSKIPKAAMGGLIEGGTPGVDSVGVLTQRGEGILKTGQTAAIIRLADAMERQGARGGGAPAAGGPQIVANFNSVVPPTSAEMSRQMMEVDKQLKRSRRWST